MIKLNLGSGQRPFGQGWINIDIRQQDYPVDIISDIKSLPMFGNNTVDVICLHHVVEHIDIGDLENYIAEWYRILKYGGKLAIFVPDISKIFAAWAQKRITTYIRNVNIYGAYQGFPSDLHRWGYDNQELLDRVFCEQSDGTNKFPWSDVKSWTLEMSNLFIYKNADIAFDWWVLAKEFTK